MAREQDKAKKTVAPAVLNHLMGQEWPGNTPQLENLIRGWYAVIPDAAITPRHLTAEACPAAAPAGEINLDEPYQDLKEKAIESLTAFMISALDTRIKISLKKSGELTASFLPYLLLNLEVVFVQTITARSVDGRRLASRGGFSPVPHH